VNSQLVLELVLALLYSKMRLWCLLQRSTPYSDKLYMLCVQATSKHFRVDTSTLILSVIGKYYRHFLESWSYFLFGLECGKQLIISRIFSVGWMKY
jgi:hypothetical protein